MQVYRDCIFIIMKSVVLCVILCLAGIGSVRCTKRRHHKENFTATVIDASFVEGEIIDTIDYDYLEDETKNEFVYSRLKFDYYDEWELFLNSNEFQLRLDFRK